MNGYPLGTWVTIDNNVPIPCTPDDLGDGKPTILDGLSFTWGRSSTVDQPDTETLNFTLREQLNPQGIGENMVVDPGFVDQDQNAIRFPETWIVEDGNVIIPESADSYRVWIVGNRMASTSSQNLPGPAPANGAMPVKPGQVVRMSLTVSASIANREIRWQVPRYGADGEYIGGVYVASNTPVPGPNVPMIFTAEYTVPSDAGYLAVAFVPEGTFGGTVTFGDPEIHVVDDITTLDQIHVGSVVSVWTEGDVPVENSETMTRTGFGPDEGELDSSWWATLPGTETPTVNVELDDSDNFAAWLTRVDDYDWTSTILFPPAPYQPTGTNPDAWDLIPQYQLGQVWEAEAVVWIPPGATATLGAYIYTSPDKSGTTTSSSATVTGAKTATGGPAGGWYTLAGQVSDNLLTGWLAPSITFDMPSPQTWAETPDRWQDQVLRWEDFNQCAVQYVSMRTADDAHREVLVWRGEVTSMVGQAAGDNAFTTAVTCSDQSGILANLKVGDDPWPVMTVQERADAIMAAIPTDANIPPVIIDSGLQATEVSYRDVDAQPPLGLFQDLAQTAGGVMWVTAHATQWGYLWMEDTATRAAVRRFVVDAGDGTVSIGGQEGDTDRGLSVVSARDVLRDPVSWTQDVTQTITQVTVSWMEQLVDDDGQPTTEDRTEIVKASAADIDKFGLRDLSVSTELIDALDASTLASRHLAQARNTGWIADGLQIDTSTLQRDIPTVSYSERLTMCLDLLDATTRIGRAITLIEVPAWTPADAVSSMYVEGGTYTWADHRWQLELTVSPAIGQGASATWDDFAGTPATWSDFNLNRITWTDAYGVAGPT